MAEGRGVILFTSQSRRSHVRVFVRAIWSTAFSTDEPGVAKEKELSEADISCSKSWVSNSIWVVSIVLPATAAIMSTRLCWMSAIFIDSGLGACTLARPRMAFSSSMVPLVSILISVFETLVPLASDVVPSSPVLVYSLVIWFYLFSKTT